MRRIIPVILLALAACVGTVKVPGYRNPQVAISSSGAFVPGRFAGDWQLVAAYGPEAACGPVAENWSVEDGRYVIRGNRCGAGGAVGVALTAAPSGPGRIVEFPPEGPRQIWVLWVDADYRVAALGTPDGAIGRIIARPGAARPDLINAAREIMAFNGYDISRLSFVGLGL